MIKFYEIFNEDDDSLLKLDVTRPDDTGLVIKQVEGLNPVKASVSVTNSANNSGGVFNSSKKETRNIVFTFGIIGNGIRTVEECRLLLYSTFAVGSLIKIKILSDKRICIATGYVESNEVSPYSKEEESVVSIICPDPGLYGLYDNTIIANRSSEDSSSTLISTYEYKGDCETGGVITIGVNHELTGDFIKIFGFKNSDYMTINGNRLNINGASGFNKGDVITINSKYGYKNVTLTRNKNKYNIIYAVDRPLSWYSTKRGTNRFMVMVSGESTDLTASLVFKNVFDGV